MSEKPYLCFFIMPFKTNYNYFFVYLKSKLESLRKYQITVKRADSNHTTEPMLNNIIQYIEMADIIIADTSDFNPNVFFEIGLAYCKQNKLILIANYDMSKIPSDLKHHVFLPYENKSPENFFIDLKTAIFRILEDNIDEFYEIAIILLTEFNEHYHLDIESNEKEKFRQLMKKDKEIGVDMPLDSSKKALKDFLMPKILKNEDYNNKEINQKINEWNPND